MATETGARLPPDAKRSSPPQPLSVRQLELSIALVQMVSDDAMQVSDWEIFAPDDKRTLARATELVYDGTPRC
jgi:hypothetical protein